MSSSFSSPAPSAPLTLLIRRSVSVVETRGFGVFNDRERLALLRRLAEERGLILLTDSDEQLQLPGPVRAAHALDPQIRLAAPQHRPGAPGPAHPAGVVQPAPGREGKLGVEGMGPAALLQALERAGATFEEACPAEARQGVTKADFYQRSTARAHQARLTRRALSSRSLAG